MSDFKRHTATIVISDHAIVRYLERVPGPHSCDDLGRLDIDAARRAILADGREAAFRAGAVSVEIDGVTFCRRKRGNTIVVTTVKADASAGPIKQPHLSNLRKSKDGRMKKFGRRPE